MRVIWLENADLRPFFRPAILTGDVGQTGLVLVCDQGSLVGLRSAHARLQVSVFSGYALCHPSQHPATHSHTHTYIQTNILTSRYEISNASSREQLLKNLNSGSFTPTYSV